VRRPHWRGQVGRTKTNRTRTVPISKELAQLLSEHRQQLLEKQARGLAEGWVFPTSAGTLMMHSALTRPLKAALKVAKIEKRFTVHGFRRACGSLVEASTAQAGRSSTASRREMDRGHWSHGQTTAMLCQPPEASNFVYGYVSTYMPSICSAPVGQVSVWV